jgi:hypothetical protein
MDLITEVDKEILNTKIIGLGQMKLNIKGGKTLN